MVANGDSGGKVAADFEKIIQEARDRKKNEALAAKIFGKGRRASTPVSKPAPAAAGSLASRAGVKKQRPVPAKGARHSTGNIDGEWTHDLHETQSRGVRTSGSGAGSLAARITDPNPPPTGPAGNRRKQRRAAQVAEALIRSELQSGRQGHQQQQPQQQQQTSFTSGTIPTAPKAMTTAATFNRGMTIRGLAGPFVVMAQNFAPGTTAADIESAMTPVGGIITSCRIVKTHPIVIAEIVFESKEGADNVIATFNNQTADGRVLSVYPKIGNTPAAKLPAQSSSDNDMIVDGSYGFDDPMDTDTGSGRLPPTGPAAGTGSSGLYSDSLVNTNRWGRGFSRGARGFGRR
ncbi:hypothetical protein C8A03DRAFT_11394 [Achaetomium macrosporum]|uniref:RRM domain-containing protein n=1 Tax=Achaetomium macrosporum TaxID=79813 RepID=A0AAN7CI45_9PEZI|nr:hypothetical protein C8A03DRAFT_11394 [Achaetomium macrosporum]